MNFPDLNTSPEINAAGAAFTPTLNSFANNLTRWDLTVEDVQVYINLDTNSTIVPPIIILTVGGRLSRKPWM